ncbi:MAG: efflux RND transporter permease subunit, partial [Polyangiales bacterium]
VFISGIVALTLSPMMASQLLKPHQHGWLTDLIDRAFNWVRDGYDRFLGGVLRTRGVVYAVWIVLTICVAPMFMFSPGELAPAEDQSFLFGVFDLPPNATMEQLTTYTNHVQKTIKDVKEFDHSFQLVTPGQGFFGFLAKPWDKRDRGVDAIAGTLNEVLYPIPGIRAQAFMPPALPSPGLFPVEFIISSTAESEELLRYAQQVTDEALKSNQFAFPPILDLKIDQARSNIEIDRNKVASMGLNLSNVGADLATMLGGNFVNRFNIDGRAYKVIPQVQRSGRLTADQLKDIYITGPGGKLMPLGAVATVKTGLEPRSLNRFQQLNSVKISGVAPQSLDAGIKALEEASAKILPPGYKVDYTGESRQLREEGGKFLPAMGLALLLIFLVLAAQFNSFRDPLVILAGSVPLAMFGAMIFTFLKFAGPPGMTFALTDGWTTTLNIYSQVGLVTLVGLVSKNGILIVEFANAQQEQGMSKIDAVREAARTRLRPILMTTIATVVGHFPLTLVTGAGAAARNSIGVVLVGGMSIGTLFTLFVVPCVYVLLAKDHSKEHLHSEKVEDEDDVGSTSLVPSPGQ